MRTVTSARSLAMLILSSVVNAALCVGSFVFARFATSPEIDDASMRAGYYVLGAITLAAAVGSVAPWALAWRGSKRAALAIAMLPTALTVLAVLAFLVLDSWVRRTFG